ncbi:DUF7619 domain-containing protein [Flexithrix dorotheae]|uniref:DUF7619 domain-containing protein n=1 Tax=Flexithrix dorotheae TaxID=70993 RepID=UPI0003806438|nr:SdrD B-like domain-containing protein [Flexithrix dorotheae]
MENTSTFNHKCILISIAFMVISLQELYATHIRGGYLTGVRTSSSSLTYKFTVTLFRDTEGVPAQPGTFEFGYANANPAVVDPISVGFIDDDTEIIIYQIEHTFPSAGTFKVTYFEQNRNPGVKNISASGNTAFFLESNFRISPLFGLNSSPVFLLPPAFRANTGKKYIYNHAAYDIDGDSLSFRLVPCKQGKNTDGVAIDVNGYLYPDHPSFGGTREDGSSPAIFEIDPETGVITWDAPGEIGEYNYAFYVDEWRDGVQISSINYDMQVIVVDEDFDIPKPEMGVDIPGDQCLQPDEAFSTQIIIKNASSYQLQNELIDAGKVTVTDSFLIAKDTINWIIDLNFKNLTTDEIRDQAYEFKIDAILHADTITKKWNVKVLGEKPSTPTAQWDLDQKNINLSWSEYPDQTASKMTIWRKSQTPPPDDLNCFSIDSVGSGFTKVGEVNISDTTFIDFNDGEEWKPFNYYYILVAQYDDENGGQSQPSDYAKAENLYPDAERFKIGGQVFYDVNENGLNDEGELGVSGIKLRLLPENIVTISNDDGNYHFDLPKGNYSIHLIPEDHWELSSDASEYNISVDGQDTTNYQFGISPTGQRSDLEIHLNNPRTRCSFEVDYHLSYKNKGTQTEDGKIILDYDNKLTFKSSIPSPSSTENGQLKWDFSNLQPSGKEVIKITFQVPGVENIGEKILNKFALQTQFFSISDSTSQTITCAYDPNDKLVTPAGVKSKNYTLKDEVLAYTVRFQNTGNDTAFNVEIRDELDSDLDLNSLEVINHSHPVRTYISKFGEAIFKFDDIHLPDSNVNEKASHGFVTFTIKPKPNLPDFTQVTNTAHIYFDFNPAIVTNTTLNTLVTHIPPEAPDSLKVSEKSATTITLSWQDLSEDESGFALERAENQQFEMSTTINLTAETSSYVDTALTSNTTYYYRLRAKTEEIYSAYSNTLKVKTEKIQISAPTDLQIVFEDTYFPKLTWRDHADNEFRYAIERALSANFSPSELFYTFANAEEYVDETVSIGQNYFYRVKATNTEGSSDFSNIVSTIITGIKLEEKATAINIYPNPVGREMVLHLSQNLGKGLIITFYNNIGELILTKTVLNTHPNQDLKLDLADLPKGFYVMQLNLGNQIISRKLIKE